MKRNKIYAQAKKTPETARIKTDGNAIVAKIISEFQDRNRADIQKWRNALNMAKNPDTPRLYALQDLYDNLESDGHWISQTGLRKAATLCADFSIVDRKTGDVNPEKTELFNTEWFYNFVNDLLDGIFKGFTLLELTDPSTMEFTLVPRRNVVPIKEMVLFEANGDKGINYATGFENRILKVGKITNLGLMADLCGQLIWKRNAQQSWAEFSEKYGHPLISATTNKTNKSDLDNIEKMLIALGEAARAVLPEGTTIDVKPFAGADSFQVFDKQIDRINSELSKPVTGGTMVSDNGSSRSQSEVHERNLDDKLSAQDKILTQFVVNGQLLPIMQAWGWDINPETDKFRYDPAFELTLKEHWDIVSGALGYFDIPEDWISTTFNMPISGKKQQPSFNTFSANLKSPTKREIQKSGIYGNFH